MHLIIYIYIELLYTSDVGVAGLTLAAGVGSNAATSEGNTAADDGSTTASGALPMSVFKPPSHSLVNKADGDNDNNKPPTVAVETKQDGNHDDKDAGDNEEEDEIDPLDAYMAVCNCGPIYLLD